MTISSAYLFARQMEAGETPTQRGIRGFIERLKNAQTESEFANQFYVHVDPAKQLSYDYPPSATQIYVSDSDAHRGVLPSYAIKSYATLGEKQNTVLYDAHDYYYYALGQSDNGNSWNGMYTLNEIYRNGEKASESTGLWELNTRNVTIGEDIRYAVTYKTNVPMYGDLTKSKTHINLMKAYWLSRTDENLAALREHMNQNASFEHL